MKTIHNNAISKFKVAEIQLCYNPKIKASERPKIRRAKDAYEILYDAWDKNKLQLVEQCKILLLNRAGKVLGITDISTGGVAYTIIDPKIVFAATLKSGATGLILSHSHPSGNLHPSEADKNMTDKIKAGCKLLEIELCDHIIITAEGYYSFAEEGHL